MKKTLTFLLLITIASIMISCNSSDSSNTGTHTETVTASDILGNPEYQAISYGGYRENTRDIQPTIPELKEDMEILYAMGIRIIRTYNVHLDHASNVLKAIRELKEEDPDFEMYVMLGAWIDAKNAWTDKPERIRYEDAERNATEIDRAVELANMYPDIVKIIAVGNEAMVHWATEYYVEPDIILNWVLHLKELRANGELPADLWITSSDNFASWGGGDPSYHKEALNELIREVDYISVHTYPMHDTHYNPEFWGVPEDETQLSDIEKIDSAMNRALDYAVMQYESVVHYMDSIGVEKPVHIGETGWATVSNEFYGVSGARAVDEFKAGEFHRLIREWSDQNNISVFYFEAFDEQWKDAANPLGSENHFGLINLESQAKYAIWDLVDEGVFDGLTRDGEPITKTYDGSIDSLMNDVLMPPTKVEISERLDEE
jgi:exo-beta-1,3-glucanase (GH17 family)